MKNNLIQQELPPGLIDTNIEIFASRNELMALFNGSVISFEKLPANVLQHFYDAMHNNNTAMAILSKIFTTEKEMLRQYAWCNFGGWNRKPDYNGNVNSEYWDCGSRGCCKHEGKLCIKLNHEEKNLTQRELQISKLIAEGYADKQIADKLDISYFTVTTIRQKIELKLNTPSKVGVASFIHINNLLVSSNQAGAH